MENCLVPVTLNNFHRQSKVGKGQNLCILKKRQSLSSKSQNKRREILEIFQLFITHFTRGKLRILRTKEVWESEIYHEIIIKSSLRKKLEIRGTRRCWGCVDYISSGTDIRGYFHFSPSLLIFSSSTPCRRGKVENYFYWTKIGPMRRREFESLLKL